MSNEKERIIKVKVDDSDYIVGENRICITRYMLGRNYGNSVGTVYKLFGKKSVNIEDWSNGWAGGGLGMTDSRSRTVINERLHNLIRETIRKIFETENTIQDEAERWETQAEILQDFEKEALSDC